MLKTLLLILVLTAPAFAGTDYYVNNGIGGASDTLNNGTSPLAPWATIGKCVTKPLIAGDTCNVTGGSYDIRTTVNINGTVGNFITFLATGSARAFGFTVTGNYIKIQGFELTTEGMSTRDGVAPIYFNGSTGSVAQSNYVHATENIYCMRSNNGTSISYIGNTVAYCGQTNDIIPSKGTNQAPLSVTINSANDQIKFKIQGGGSITKTIPNGTYNVGTGYDTLVGTMNGTTLVGTGAYFKCGGSGNCSLTSLTYGATSSIELETVSNDAYTAFGWTVGVGTMEGHASGIGGFSTANTDVLVSGNTISHINFYYQAGIGDTKVVMKDNTLGPIGQFSFNHTDGYFGGGGAKILLENNVATYNNNADNRVPLGLFQSASDSQIIARYNSSFNSSGKMDCSRNNDTTKSGIFLYNNTVGVNANTIVNSGDSQIVCAATTGNFARNNIWYNSSPASPYRYTDNIDKDYDLWFGGTGDPVETNDINADPLFTSISTGNYALLPGSPAINHGGHLTLANGAAASPSTSLTVDQSGFFQDGWAGVSPDCIAIGTVSNTACITSINYTTHVITLATSLTWADNATVWLYKKSDGTIILNGSAPDIGAFESDGTAPVPGNSGTITTASISYTTLTLNWTKATDNLTAQASLQYEVRKSSSNNMGTVANAEANGTIIGSYTADIATFNVTGLSAATTYYFTVIVKDSTSNKAIYSTVSEITLTDITAPVVSPGTITASAVTSSSLTLGWARASDDATVQASLQYQLYRSSSSNIGSVALAEANGIIVQAYTADLVSVLLTGLTDSTTFHFNVIVKDSAGNKTAYTAMSQATDAIAAVGATNLGNTRLRIRALIR